VNTAVAEDNFKDGIKEEASFIVKSMEHIQAMVPVGISQLIINSIIVIFL
jgi:hypothetical protein